MKPAIALGLALGIVGTGAAVAQVITNDTAITAPPDTAAVDIRSLQLTSPATPNAAPAPDAARLPAPGVLVAGSMTPSGAKAPSGGAESSPVTPSTVPTPGALSLMAMSAVTIMGRARRAPAGK